MNTHLRYDTQTRTETDAEIIATLVRKGWEVYTPEPESVIHNTYTANAWLEKEGYGPTQLVTLLDLSSQLQVAGKISVKLDAVKNWTNEMLSEYIQSSNPKENWSNAPFKFNDVVTEAFEILNQ